MLILIDGKMDSSTLRNMFKERGIAGFLRIIKHQMGID
jgi:hypothetical protein